MVLPLSPDELLSTTRAVRKRLDLTRPVERQLLDECLDLALQAPTASMRQDWHLVASDDREVCRRVGQVYSEVWHGMISEAYLAKAADSEPDPVARASWLKMMDSARYLADHFPEVPALLVPCIEGRLEGAPILPQANKWGSIVQATWSFMLAARARGLGTCWTTVHLQREADVAEILGIPYDRVQQIALIPVAHTVGTDFKPGARKARDRYVHWNGW